MVDRNRNGIPDEDEKPGRREYAKPKPISPIGGRRPQVEQNPVVSKNENPFGGLVSLGRTLGGALGLGRPSQSPAERVAPKGAMWKLGRGPRAALPPVEDTQKTFADYLNEAMSLLGGEGQGGGAGVSYDPQRQTLRSNASEADARLEAMYRQLRGSIDADAPVLQQAYGEAIDSTADVAQRAQDQIQGASDAASARNSQVLANLGIEQAQGNIIQEGRDLETQTAGAIADSAGLGQAAGNRLVSNQATALQHNTNIGNAAGLEGNLQRAANQAKLQSLLAEIDMREQQDNAALAAQSGGGNRLSQAFDFASEMAGFDRYNQEREDELQMSAQELAAKQKAPLPNFDQMIQALAARGIAIPEDPADLARLLDSSRRYSF